MAEQLRGGVCVNGLPVAGICHAGRRIGLTHGGSMLVPSGKNLLRWSEMTAFDGLVKTTVTDDGGLHVKTKAGLHCWYGISWDIPLSDIGVTVGDTLTASLADDEQLGGGMLLNLKFLTDSYGGYTVQKNFGWGNVEVMTIPEDTITIQFTVMATTDISADLSKTIHPQLERGSARTCWEPPEKLRGGGTLKDLNLAPAWNPAPNNPQGLTYTVDSHRLSIGIPYTGNRWVTWYSQWVAFPAGVYTVYGTGSRWDAFTIYNDRNTILTHVDRSKILLTLSSETTLELHVGWESKGSQIDANFTPVILEGDWTTT